MDNKIVSHGVYENDERCICVSCGTPVNITGVCSRCELQLAGDRLEIEQTNGLDDCLFQVRAHRPFSHCPVPERQELERTNPYLDSVSKTPKTLAEVVGELEDVAEMVKHGTMGSINRMKELRQKVIKAAITVKGCVSTWEFEREHRAGEAPMPGMKKQLLLFFGPSVADDRTTKDMKRTGTLPENQMDDRINQLMMEGWRVVFRHFDPSFHVEQWRVVLERV